LRNIQEQLRHLYELGDNSGNFSELLLFCETSVNDGSPSGYQPTVAPRYSPSAGIGGFSLPFCALDRSLVSIVGPLPDWMPTSHTHALVPVHPIIAADRTDVTDVTLTVVPTASVRTVAVLSPERTILGFLKLHYPSKLGRFSRDLYHFKWIASLEADAAFREAAAFGRVLWMPENFGWYCEPSSDSSERGWGVLGRTTSGASFLDCPLIPAFSIISRVSRYAVLEHVQSTYEWTVQTACTALARNLVEVYIELALRWGLLPECNAQNVLYHFAPDGEVYPVFRDMGDVFKDTAIRRARGLSCSFCEYKTIDWTSPDLLQRRSFSYDFKLGEYILRPLGSAIATIWRADESYVLSLIRKQSREAWGAEASEYFSNVGEWFSYPVSENVSRDSYVVNYDPQFR
jgi:hypothetical protein